MLKEGTATAEDVMCIIRDIADNPEEMRELVEVLGIDGDQLPEDGTDSVDGAKISSCHPMLTNVTYEGLYAALDSKSLNRRDLIHKHCLINKGRPKAISHATSYLHVRGNRYMTFHQK